MRRTGGRRSPSWLPEPARPQSYALFWWWTAFLLPASTLVHSHVPALSEELYISCSWSGWEPADTSWSAAVAWISEILAVLFPGIPVVLVLCAWLVARRGSGRPRVHLWAAGTAVTLIAGSYTLSRVQSLLEPVPEYATCTVDPATLNEVSPARIALALTPAALVLVAAWTGLRPPPLPPRRPVPWRPILVAAALFALPVAGAVALMRLTPYEPAEPVLAADGTPRYALALGDRLTVVDLAEGGEPVTVAAPDPEFYQYTAIAPDREPGRYVASVTTAGDGAFGGRRSRIHRVDLDGDGGAVVLGQVGPEVEGMISDVAVSPSGEIAYARLVAEPGDSFEVGTTHVGLVNARREWSAPRGQGLGAFGDGALGLHWRDAGTLVFRAVPPKARSPRLVALDVRRPGADLFAATTTVHAMPELSDGLALARPGGERMLLSKSAAMDTWNHELLVLQPPARPRVTGSAFHAGCGFIAGFTLDPSGRHALVAVDYRAGMYQGDPPEPMCPGAPPYALYRIDLAPPPGAATPNPAGYSQYPDLGLPHRSVWEGDRPIGPLAW